MLNFVSSLKAAALRVPSHLQAMLAHNRPPEALVPHSLYWAMPAILRLLQEETLNTTEMTPLYRIVSVVKTIYSVIQIQILLSISYMQTV